MFECFVSQDLRETAPNFGLSSSKNVPFVVFVAPSHRMMVPVQKYSVSHQTCSPKIRNKKRYKGTEW